MLYSHFRLALYEMFRFPVYVGEEYFKVKLSLHNLPVENHKRSPDLPCICILISFRSFTALERVVKL